MKYEIKNKKLILDFGNLPIIKKVIDLTKIEDLSILDTKLQYRCSGKFSAVFHDRDFGGKDNIDKEAFMEACEDIIFSWIWADETM